MEKEKKARVCVNESEREMSWMCLWMRRRTLCMV